MRISVIIVLFLLLIIILAGMSIPLWWESASPHIFKLPQYIAGIISDIKDFVDMILKRL
ncbi:MAG: hypothetical protein Q8M95_00680 [Candidatus Methanoperedens sp.]|nr:hypothetical protein [Candidatus Methanoperedens sp.]